MRRKTPVPVRLQRFLGLRLEAVGQPAEAHQHQSRRPPDGLMIEDSASLLSLQLQLSQFLELLEFLVVLHKL